MATIKCYLRKDKINAAGKCPLELRIRHNYQEKKVATDIKICPKDWDQKSQKVKSSDLNYLAYNNALKEKIALGERKIFEMRSKNIPVTVSAIQAHLQDRDGQDFYTYAKNIIEGCNHWNKKKYTTTINKLKDFHPRSLEFENITATFLNKFDMFLETDKKYENCRNTRNKEIGRIRFIINMAMDENVITPDQNIFVRGYKLRWEETDPTWLEIDELEALLLCEPEEGSPEWHAKNYFLFSFYAFGMRFGDLVCLKWENVAGGVLNYIMNKNQKGGSPELADEAIAILDLYRDNGSPYVFGLLEPKKKYTEVRLRQRISVENAIANRSLKNLAALAGIDKNLSTHVARHTFGYINDVLNTPLRIIQHGFRHSNAATTERYIGRMRPDRYKTEMTSFFGKLRSIKTKKEAS